jgi:hypothetical protein
MFHPVKEPKHYAGNGDIACMDALKSMLYGSEDVLAASQIYWWGCAFKYLWRWLWKNGRQDLEKAQQCIKYLMEEIDEHQNKAE